MILDRLAATRRPLAATCLGAQLGVSRQVIVGLKDNTLVDVLDTYIESKFELCD